MKKKRGVLAAGGTGGHINSALALGEQFSGQGYDILYVSGNRILDYNLFKGKNVLHLEAQPLRGKNVLKLFFSLWKNVGAFLGMVRLFWRERPLFALGAGGYVCGPTLMAAFVLGIPVFILEQNSVMGLTNRILALFSEKIFLNFHQTLGVPGLLSRKILVTGNPVRASLAQFFEEDRRRKKGEEKFLNFLVFGGSLGATSINELVWEYLKDSNRLPFSVHIRHQLGPEKKKWEGQMDQMDQMGKVHYEPVEYLNQIEKDYAWSDVILCRSGASSVSELRIIKRPVVLIPYPFHRDRHQFINAERLKERSTFPVYIETCEELKKGSFARWEEILHSTYSEKFSNAQSAPQGEETVLVSTKNIFQEIEKHV